MNLSTEKRELHRNRFKSTRLWKLVHYLYQQRNGNQEHHCSGNGYLESIEYFRQRYFIEQRRAERKGYEFCLIIFELTPDQENSNQQSENALLKEAEEALYTTSKRGLRATDVTVKYCPNKVAILLPDTGQKGSEKAVQRITDLLNNTTNVAFSSIFQRLRIHSFSYPLHENEINDLINNKIFDEKRSTAELEKTVRNIKSYCLPHNGHQVNSSSELFDFRITSTDTVVLDNPFCLLNGVFFNGVCDWQKLIKRGLDVALSLLVLILFLPVLLLASILIKLTSPGPVFFKQQRIGYMGKKFIIYKFRTMYDVKDEGIHRKYIANFINSRDEKVSNSNPGTPVYKLKNDPRITSIGKLLRRTSIDELVQLFNVIKGDMSLVGPRPPIPYEVEMYELWHKRRYLTVKPGMTGLWQIYGRSKTAFNDMVRLDLAYVENWSLVLDLKILFKTVGAVLSMKGAY